MEVFLALIGIIAAIFSNFFFRDRADQNEENTGSPRRNQTAPNPSSSGDGTQMSRDAHADFEPESADIPASVKEQQEEQLQQLTERMNPADNRQTQASEQYARKQHSSRAPAYGGSSSQQMMRQQMRHNLTREDLVNGVIMSEVLGQPRALKPYRSPVARRKQKM